MTSGSDRDRDHRDRDQCQHSPPPRSDPLAERLFDEHLFDERLFDRPPINWGCVGMMVSYLVLFGITAWSIIDWLLS